MYTYNRLSSTLYVIINPAFTNGICVMVIVIQGLWSVIRPWFLVRPIQGWWSCSHIRVVVSHTPVMASTKVCTCDDQS